MLTVRAAAGLTRVFMGGVLASAYLRAVFLWMPKLPGDRTQRLVDCVRQHLAVPTTTDAELDLPPRRRHLDVHVSNPRLLLAHQ